MTLRLGQTRQGEVSSNKPQMKSSVGQPKVLQFSVRGEIVRLEGPLVSLFRSEGLRLLTWEHGLRAFGHATKLAKMLL